MSDIVENIRKINARIETSAKKTGRALQDITLVAVSKTVPAERINEAVSAGIDHIGENRVQEAREKFPLITKPVTKHMIGHLQKNKVKYAVKLFDMIQSVDTLELAMEINKRTEKPIPVLIEVNTSGEESKYGCMPGEALTLLKAVSKLEQLRVKGFMTIALFSDEIEKVRPCFRLLKNIFDNAQVQHIPNSDISILSMGMSADFETAIEEGANMVRIGTAIFGPRRILKK